MATLQERNGSYRVLFLWNGKRESFTLGRVDAGEAEAKAAQVDYLTMRLRQGLLTLPAGVSISEFVQYDGRPPAAPTAAPVRVTLGQLRDRYIETHESSLEPTSVQGIRIHFRHLVKHLGEQFRIADLSLLDLQGYVDKRTKAKGKNGRMLSAATIKKEIVSLRTAWNWGAKMKYVSGRFPNDGLRYPKLTEKPTFQTYAEIKRAIELGGLTTAEQADLWNAMYLTVCEMTELLQLVKSKAAQPFVYPMIAFAAHTGARRSEIVRLRIADIDLKTRYATITEKKRVHGMTSTRRVPLSPFLVGVLTKWLAEHPGGAYLFCHRQTVVRSKKRSAATGYVGAQRPTSVADRLAMLRPRMQVSTNPLTRDEAADHFRRAIKGSKWRMIRGWHTLRHSFISACASRGVDQRLVEAWAGHMSKEMSKRYAHLWPSVQQEALASVFSTSGVVDAG